MADIPVRLITKDEDENPLFLKNGTDTRHIINEPKANIIVTENSGKYLYSINNGIDWVSSTIYTGATLNYSVMYAKNIFLACPPSNYTFQSPNYIFWSYSGKKWEKISTTLNYGNDTFYNIVYDRGTFFFSTASNLYKSKDGKNYKKIPLIVGYSKIRVSNNKLFAFYRDTQSVPYFKVSKWGKENSWVQYNLPLNMSGYVTEFPYINNKYIFYYNATTSYVSSDLISWTLVSGTNLPQYSRMSIRNNDTILNYANGTTNLLSTDEGTTWNTVTFPETFAAIKSDGENFVAISNTKLYKSTNGINWDIISTFPTTGTKYSLTLT
jgi:hypothetical protein